MLPGVGVNISKFQHRVPDVAVVRVGSLESFFQETPPELVVEVASARTRLYDRNELRSGAYEQTAHVIGGEEYRAAVPFPVTIVPFQLVTAK